MDRFNARWRQSQRRHCDYETWYLLPWTDLAWSELADASLLSECARAGMSFYAQYVLSVVLMKFHDRTDAPELRKIATT